jgi:hypothetical protein
MTLHFDAFLVHTELIRHHFSHQALLHWEFQDPKLEVLYRIKPYFQGLSPYRVLSLALYMVDTSNLGS